MALMLSTLKAQLSSAWAAPNTSSVEAAQKTTDAIIAYWSNGMHPTGGVVVPASSYGIVFSGLSSAWVTPTEKNAMIDAVVNAIDGGLLAVVIAGGSFGTGGVKTATKSVLTQKLNIAYNNPSTGVEHGQLLADAIDAYTKTNVVYGTGIPPLVPRPEGPFV